MNDNRAVSEIRVAVLEESDLLREGVTALLRTADGVSCVGTWSDARTTCDSLPGTRPDVLLGDVRILSVNGFAPLREMLGLVPSMRVIAMADCSEEHCIVLHPKLCCGRTNTTATRLAQAFLEPDDCRQMAMKMGAHGAIDKTRPFATIMQAIRSVYEGGYWMEQGTARRLAQQYLVELSPSGPAETPKVLTSRERNIATLIALGRSNKEIAQELQLGYSTIKNYVSSILDKLELRDRTQIAVYAADQASVPGERA